jgi:hypothetical protein
MRCRGIGVILAGCLAAALFASSAAAGAADSGADESAITVNGNRHVGADKIR